MVEGSLDEEPLTLSLGKSDDIVAWAISPPARVRVELQVPGEIMSQDRALALFRYTFRPSESFSHLLT